MLKEIRKNTFINSIVRSTLNFLPDNKLIKGVKSRWRVSGNIPLEFDGNKFNMLTKCDDGFVDILYYKRVYHEERDLRIFLGFAKKSTTILDVGANTGLYSLLSARVNPTAEIFAFEPYFYNAQRLKKNIELNKCNNITVIENAVGEMNNVVQFSIPLTEMIIDVASVNEEFTKSVYGNQVQWKKVDVNQVSLDSFKETNLKNKKIDLIKIDVESYEMSVFNGSVNIFNTDRPVVLFESFMDDERIAFFNQFTATNKYYVYMVLNDGIVRLDSGFQINPGGLNFLLSSKKSLHTFTSFSNFDSIINELF
jgi:FkbM family methyltransferase